jgi:hypothetical protein
VKHAKARAIAKGIECSITAEEIAERIEAGVCEMTGLAFSLRPTRLNVHDPFSPSLDRHDRSKGYTPTNTRVVVNAFNVAKGQWPLATFEAIARAYLARRGRHEAPARALDSRSDR